MSNDEVKYETLVTIDGVYKTTLNETFRRRKPWTPVNKNHLLSDIPGTVKSIEVKAGDKVIKGQELMVYTAMKMNNTIKAPKDAVIKCINVNVGDRLPKGSVMIEFE